MKPGAAIAAVVTAAGRIAAWAGFLLVLVTVFDVATRNLSQSGFGAIRDVIAAEQTWIGSTRLQELEWHLHTVLFAFCLGWAYLKGAHVRIGVVRDRLSPRVQAWIEIAGIVLFLLPFCALVLHFSLDFVARSFAQGEGSATAAGLPHRWIIKSALPVGFALLALAGIARLIAVVRDLRSGAPAGNGDMPAAG